MKFEFLRATTTVELLAHQFSLVVVVVVVVAKYRCALILLSFLQVLFSWVRLTATIMHLLFRTILWGLVNSKIIDSCLTDG
jgi:hypothetical protein